MDDYDLAEGEDVRDKIRAWIDDCCDRYERERGRKPAHCDQYGCSTMRLVLEGIEDLLAAENRRFVELVSGWLRFDPKAERTDKIIENLFSVDEQQRAYDRGWEDGTIRVAALVMGLALEDDWRKIEKRAQEAAKTAKG